MQVAEKHHPDPKRPRRLARALLGPGLLLLITVAMFWKLVLSDQYTWLESPDLAQQVLPWFQFQAGEWHRGHFPLWDPYHHAGQSLIGQAQPGAAYPLNWILFSLPLRRGWIRQACLHWYFVLIHFLAALFCYWLCRDLKRSRVASVFAGVIFGLSGYIGTTDWPQMLNGAIWAPLVFLFMLRAMRGVRPLASAALAGMFLGVSWLSGHHQIPVFLTLAAAGVWVYHLVRNRRVWRCAAVFAVFFVLTGALQTLPALEYGRLAFRWVGSPNDPVGWNQAVPYTVHANFSLYPVSVLGIIVPGLFRHTNPFLGIVALSLGVLALALRPRKSAVHLLAVLSLGGLLMALGENSLLHGVLYAVMPLVEKARVPATAIFIFHFGASCLTAYGIDGLLKAVRSPWVARTALVLAVLSGLVYCVLLGFWLAEKELRDARIGVSALVALLLAAVLSLRWRGQLSWSATTALCLGLALIELSNVTGYSLLHRSVKERTGYVNQLTQHADLVGFLKSQPWPWRVDVDDREIGFNLGDWHAIDVYSGYFASLPADLFKLGLSSRRAQALLSVTHRIGREPAHDGQREVYRSRSGLKVFANPEALPRIRSVHELKPLPPGAGMGQYLNDPDFDLRRTAVLTGPLPELERCSGPDRVRLLRRETDRLLIEADMQCKGLVVVSESHFPGWKATVDGRPAEIHAAYTVLRSVVVGAGKHRIEMRYRPLSVLLGALMTALGIAGACALALFQKR